MTDLGGRRARTAGAIQVLKNRRRSLQCRGGRPGSRTSDCTTRSMTSMSSSNALSSNPAAAQSTSNRSTMARLERHRHLGSHPTGESAALAGLEEQTQISVMGESLAVTLGLGSWTPAARSGDSFGHAA